VTDTDDAFELGPTRYGKAEVRLVHIAKSGPERTIKDLNVSIALSGDQAETHLTGDNAKVLTTDAQKNTVYGLAKESGVRSPESFGLLLARHFLGACEFITHARVAVEEYGWDRVPGVNSRHSFQRSGGPTRTALVHADIDGTASVVSGIKDLVLLNATGSEFQGFYKERFTTLPETKDRVLATAVEAQWLHDSADGADWEASYDLATDALLRAFADTYSRSLQQTLYAMGREVLARAGALREIRLALPNRHHFTVDLEPFGLSNDNEVFFPADRPYGLIEGTVRRAGAVPDERPWN